MTRHRPAHFHAERADPVLMQRQGSRLEINPGLQLGITLDALGGKQSIEE
jgi:hypothetical protein